MPSMSCALQECCNDRPGDMRAQVTKTSSFKNVVDVALRKDSDIATIQVCILRVSSV